MGTNTHDLGSGRFVGGEEPTRDDHLATKKYVDDHGGGNSVDVTDGSTTVTGLTELDFTSGATVTDAGGGVAQVAVEGGGGVVPFVGVNPPGSPTDGMLWWDPDDNTAVGGSQPFTPTDLDGLALWLDASTLALADDAPVATWPDASDSGFDATQGDPDFQPVCKTAVMNGKRVVRFVDSPDVQNLALSGAALDLFRNLDACTIAAVAGNATGTGSYVALAASADGDVTLTRVRCEYHGDNVAAVYGCNDDSGSDADNASIKFGGSSPKPTVALVGTIDFAGKATVMEATMPPTAAGIVLFADTPGALPDTGSDAILVGAAADASGGSNCDYAEILVYQRALNATERRQVLEYLSSKWATL